VRDGDISRAGRDAAGLAESVGDEVVVGGFLAGVEDVVGDGVDSLEEEGDGAEDLGGVDGLADEGD
jgi:hypothetical protein